MRFGLFSNGQRLNALAKTSYDEDLEEVILADRLGIGEAWISEHGVFVNFQAPDQLPCADPFITKAAALTKQIKMGPGIRALPYFHPLQAATDAAVCDHLTGGRYFAGFGMGLGGAGEKLRGAMPGTPRVRFREAIDVILTAWEATEPFDWNGEIWQGKGWHIIPKPMTKLDVGIACTGTEGTLELTAEKGLLPLFGWTSSAAQLYDMIEVYLRTPNRRGAAPARDRVRVSRVVYVADSVAAAKRELHDADLGGALSGRRLDAFIRPGDSRAQLDMEYLIDCGAFFCGDPDTVYDGIANFHRETGGFGVLLLIAGKDWGTHEQRLRSMTRFMTEVAPRLATLGSSGKLLR